MTTRMVSLTQLPGDLERYRHPRRVVVSADAGADGVQVGDQQRVTGPGAVPAGANGQHVHAHQSR